MKNPVVYVVNNSFLPSSYIPSTDEERDKYFLQTLDMLVASVLKFRETNIGIPKFLVLKDTIANNIFWGCLYSYENELLSKFADKGLPDINFFHCLATQKSISVVEKISEDFPDYYLGELKDSINSLLPYMEPDDGTENYLVYKLDKNQDKFAIGKEIINYDEEQSLLWDEYFDLMKRSEGREIERASNRYVKVPKNYEGRKYSTIFMSGEMLEAELVYFSLTDSGQGKPFGFYWKISETDLRSIGSLVAWKKIN